jgi:hypothetical protein
MQGSYKILNKSCLWCSLTWKGESPPWNLLHPGTSVILLKTFYQPHCHPVYRLHLNLHMWAKRVPSTPLRSISCLIRDTWEVSIQEGSKSPRQMWGLRQDCNSWNSCTCHLCIRTTQREREEPLPRKECRGLASVGHWLREVAHIGPIHNQLLSSDSKS